MICFHPVFCYGVLRIIATNRSGKTCKMQELGIPKVWESLLWDLHKGATTAGPLADSPASLVSTIQTVHCRILYIHRSKEQNANAIDFNFQSVVRFDVSNSKLPNGMYLNSENKANSTLMQFCHQSNIGLITTEWGFFSINKRYCCLLVFCSQVRQIAQAVSERSEAQSASFQFMRSEFFLKFPGRSQFSI